MTDHISSEFVIPSPPRSVQVIYQKPPIIERVMVVEAIMTPEQFEEGIEGWRQEVASEYPYEEPLTEWLLNMKEKDGIPLLDTMEPELKITGGFRLLANKS